MSQKASTDVKISTFLVENGGMRLWIMKWTFKDKNIDNIKIISLMATIVQWLWLNMLNFVFLIYVKSAQDTIFFRTGVAWHSSLNSPLIGPRFKSQLGLAYPIQSEPYRLQWGSDSSPIYVKAVGIAWMYYNGSIGERSRAIACVAFLKSDNTLVYCCYHWWYRICQNNKSLIPPKMGWAHSFVFVFFCFCTISSGLG